MKCSECNFCKKFEDVYGGICVVYPESPEQVYADHFVCEEYTERVTVLGRVHKQRGQRLMDAVEYYKCSKKDDAIFSTLDGTIKSGTFTGCLSQTGIHEDYTIWLFLTGIYFPIYDDAGNYLGYCAHGTFESVKTNRRNLEVRRSMAELGDNE